MSKAAEIKRALIEALGMNPNLPITAEVVSVQDKTCTVKLASELVLTDVRLCATINESGDVFIIKPAVGSEVICISQTGKLSGLMVVKVDTIENIQFKKGVFEFVVDGTDGKVTIKNGENNLGSLINELIDTVAGLQIINTDSTTGQLQPQIIQSLNAIKTKFNTVLKS